MNVSEKQGGLVYRPRRLRRKPQLRALVRENHLRPEDLVYPLFVRHGQNLKKEIASMPGVYQWSPDLLPSEVETIAKLGIPAVILFGIPKAKDPVGMENFDPNGIVQQAIQAIKASVPEMLVITDVCLCGYTDHGHCGLLNQGPDQPHPHLPTGSILNDPSLDVIARVARSHAEVGADMVAPSGMLDGMVAAIRASLDAAYFEHIPILSYAVKYASSYYGPFRDAAESPPSFGDRKSHQMDPANLREALREASLDVNEGADILMVKPALSYLDVIHAVRQAYPQIPLAAYNVSGEYSMVKAAAARGWIDERSIVLENLTAMKRAGADFILSYHAKEACLWLES
jgi:porphobilinogen synthase